MDSSARGRDSDKSPGRDNAQFIAGDGRALALSPGGAFRAKQTQFPCQAAARGTRAGVRLCKTNPIRHAGQADGSRLDLIVRNKPNSGADCAKRTQSPLGADPEIGVPGKRTCETKPICLSAPLTRPVVQTKPISGGGGWLYKQTQFRGGASVRNKANWHRSVKFEVSSLKPERRECKTKPISTMVPIGRSAFPEDERAKQSQFGGKADVGRDAQPTKSRSCGTKPISGGGGQLYKQTQFRGGASVRNKANWKRSFKFEVASVKLEEQMVGASDFTLYTSHSAEGRSCETKPIEEVSSVKCQVLSEQGPAASLPGLPTSNFTLQTAAQPPGGGS